MNNKLKFLLASIIAFILIISSIKTALSVLKEEAVNNYMTISKLNARAMSKEINQDISNMVQSMNNITSIFNLATPNININKKLKEIQKNYGQIRSINILNKKNEIIFSSNTLNLDLSLNNLNLYPKPIFDENILRISTPWIGRDFISASDVYRYEEDIVGDESFFIPIAKKIQTKKGEFTIIINLNSDYFINRFISNLDSNKMILELSRIDGILLLSTKNPKAVGKKIKETTLLKEVYEHSEVSAIETLNNKKFILTHILTDNYPINLTVKLDYDKSLISWNKKQYSFFITTTLIIIFTILLSLYLFYLYNKKREAEIKSHKLQIKNQEKFRLVFQDSHLLSVVINKEGKIEDINKSFLKFLDEELKAVKGLYIWEVIILEEKERAYIRNFFKRKSSKYNSEIKVQTLKNKTAILDLNLSKLRHSNEEIYIALAQDITQRKDREKELQQAYTVFNNTKDGIIITDININILEVNKAFIDITGYTKSDIINQSVRILKSNIYDEHYYKRMWTSINRYGYWEGEITNKKKDNTLYTEWLTINTIYDENNNILNYIGIFSDITEQKSKEEQLRQKEKLVYQQSKLAAMGEMIENIAHQWRQPLSVISTAATGIKMQKELGVSNQEDEIHALDSINESAQFLSNTIDDFRTYLNNDRKQINFNISEAIDYSLKLISSKLKNREINIIKEYEDISILGIKNEFVQVVLNIISNSKDAFENSSIKDKYLFISTKINNDIIELQIKDNAGGIDESIMDKIFEPYFTTKHKSQGTGIGLYMSSEIIKNHMKGTITAKNEEYTYKNTKYKGANFIIKINKS